MRCPLVVTCVRVEVETSPVDSARYVAWSRQRRMTTTLLDNGFSRSCVSDDPIAALMILIPGDDVMQQMIADSPVLTLALSLKLADRSRHYRRLSMITLRALFFTYFITMIYMALRIRLLLLLSSAHRPLLFTLFI